MPRSEPSRNKSIARATRARSRAAIVVTSSSRCRMVADERGIAAEATARGCHVRVKAWAWAAAGLVLVALVGWDFATATTFLGDDYIFRLFGRLEANPFVAFVADKHGGEYYRPIPMLLWWTLERLAGGQAWVFALVSFLLHLLCAALLVAVGRVLGLDRRTAMVAGALFFVSPAQREAALWFSASTDLLAVACVLGAAALFLSTGRWQRPWSVLVALVACFCKESALVLPALLSAGLWFRDRQQGVAPSLRRCVVPVVPHLAGAAAYLFVRFLVLGGLGGAGDPVAPWYARGLQLASGLVHAVTAYAPLPDGLAWAAGAPLLALAVVVAWRRSPWGRFALVWVGLTLLPLPAAGWVVGARYFYLPAAGLFLLVAIALAAAGRPVLAASMAFLIGLGVLTGHHRAAEIRRYRQAVATADAAVREGRARGHRIFLVRGGLKDLDLALKLPPWRAKLDADFAVLADVPASFLWLPHDLAQRLDFVLAHPPLPPSGAYGFGGERIAGQARREDAPALDLVLSRLPELRILQLRDEGGSYAWFDRTEEYR